MTPSPTAPTSELARLLDAVAFSADRHRNQRRKDAEASPYINHPIALARLIAADGGVTDVEVLMAAILHDTVEDTNTSLQELRDRFGDRVAGIVSEVTDDKNLYGDAGANNRLGWRPSSPTIIGIIQGSPWLRIR